MSCTSQWCRTSILEHLLTDPIHDLGFSNQRASHRKTKGMALLVVDSPTWYVRAGPLVFRSTALAHPAVLGKLPLAVLSKTIPS